MPLQLGPVPNFNVQIPDLTQKAMQGAQLRALLSEQALRQQLAPLQVQQQQQQTAQAGIQTQNAQAELDSRKAMMAAVANGELNKFAGVQTDDGTGFDAGGAYQYLMSKGVLPQQANEYVSSWLNIGKSQAEISKNLGEAGKAQQEIREKTLKQVGAKLAAIGDMNVSDASKALTAFQQSLATNPKAYAGLSHEDLALLHVADLAHLPALEGHLGILEQVMDYHKSQLGLQEQQQKIINPATGLSPEMTAQAQKDIAVQQATQPLKIQTAMAEAKAKQLLEGMTRPGYAFDPATGMTRLTDQTQYLQSGGKLQGFRPVTEKDVRDDTMLTNRLGDVHQKLAEYEQALRKPITSTEKSDIAGLLGEGTKGAAGAKIGFLGAGAVIPMDRLNAFMDSASLGELSANARDQLIAYRNMREALVGYKTVLSGSARGSDKTMELLEQMIPSPAVTDRDFSQRSLNSFRGNLNVVGQGLPTLPGIKSPTDWENQYRQQRFSRQQAPSKLMQQMGLIGSPPQP